VSAYPKSPREMTSGMVYFPRMLDKIRLHARGELHEDYHTNLGAVKAADGACCNFLRVHYRDLCERVLQGGTDDEILEWCFGKRPPPECGGHRGLERFCLEARLARFHDAAISRIKESARRYRSRGYRVCSRPDGFRRRKDKIAHNNSYPSRSYSGDNKPSRRRCGGDIFSRSPIL